MNLHACLVFLSLQRCRIFRCMDMLVVGYALMKQFCIFLLGKIQIIFKYLYTLKIIEIKRKNVTWFVVQNNFEVSSYKLCTIVIDS